jgi:hypothetical protein
MQITAWLIINVIFYILAGLYPFERALCRQLTGKNRLFATSHAAL